jgi:cytochrome c
MYRCTRLTLIALVALSPVAVAGSASATGDEGQVAFNNHCRTCHSLKQDDNRLGPTLYRILGAKAGNAPGYVSYSQGLVRSGIVWDEKTLEEFIANPDAVIPTNNMKPYKGITDKTVRAQIVRFLKSQGG